MEEGFRIACGCTCSRCGTSVILEGVDDADGNHYCPECDDYVKVDQSHCAERTPEKVRERQAAIDAARQS